MLFYGPFYAIFHFKIGRKDEVNTENLLQTNGKKKEKKYFLRVSCAIT